MLGLTGSPCNGDHDRSPAQVASQGGGNGAVVYASIVSLDVGQGEHSIALAGA